MVLRSSNVKNGEIADADNVYVNPEIATSENVRKGDIIVVVRNGSRALIGKHAEIKESMPNTVIGAFMTGIRSEHSSFVNALLGTSQFEKEIEKNMGATINQITGYMFSKMEFMIPGDEEQEAIGKYFKELDNLITLHQRMLFLSRNSFYALSTPTAISWEQRKFSLVFEGLQNNTLSRAELNYESGTVKNVHYGDVLIKFGDYIDACKTELPCISDDAKADKFKNSFLQDGDIIIADTAEDDTVGKCTEIKGSEGLKLLSGLHTIACRPKQKYGPMFLGYYINSPAYHNQLKPLMQGIKVTSISKSALQDTDMILPKSIDEQIKIGEYFSNIDNLITLHQRKPYVIESYHQAWEQRKLEAAVDSVDTGKSKFDKEGSSGEYPILGSTSVIGYDDEYDYEGDFILTARVGANAGSLYRYAGKVKISDNTVFIQASQNIEFLYHLLTQFDIKKLSFGTGQPLVKASELKNLELMMPRDINEQTKIGDYFKQLDNLITLHRRASQQPKRRTYKWIQRQPTVRPCCFVITINSGLLSTKKEPFVLSL
ncbi:Restriction endonuclease S subunit [Butyrivibrio sp. INlla14]|nr:Restriction endonuclease S subunit [Butyrivibrio sp. INlla14]